MTDHKKTIQVTSGVSSRTGQPFVDIRWCHERGQLDAVEARQLGMSLIEAAITAEGDAAVVKGLGGPADETAVMALRMLRVERGAFPQWSVRTLAEAPAGDMQ